MRPGNAGSGYRSRRRKKHYVPNINRFLISALYHEAKSRKMPMTKLAETLLTESLSGTEGWRVAEDSFEEETQVSPPSGL